MLLFMPCLVMFDELTCFYFMTCFLMFDMCGRCFLGDLFRTYPPATSELANAGLRLCSVGITFCVQYTYSIDMK